jgi:magnesium chelatase subunit D
MKLKRTNYPFTAIVGQEQLKKALLLCAINPAIGGILIQGDKGTAKSTAARSLADVIPSLNKIEGCCFNCRPEYPASLCEVCNSAERTVEQVRAPFITLPLGATEERVLGSLDLEAVLIQKKKKFQPGLLAAVHQGILYIDEVNLLPDHLVDVLLDVSAMGENMIEREGLSLSHPSRFTLIGTMNPEEGQLRPQFLDRFGLMVNVGASEDITERTEVVRRRIAFETDQQLFIQRWDLEQENLQQQVAGAKELLPKVVLDDDLLTLISELTTAHGVKSLRADIVIYKTAITLAALDQRTLVTADDIREAATFALAHRSKTQPFSPPSPSAQNPEHTTLPDQAQGNAEQFQQDQPGETNDSPEKGTAGEKVFETAAAMALPKIEGRSGQSRNAEQTGKRTAVANVKRGAFVRAEHSKHGSELAVEATIMHAVLRDPEQVEVSIADLHHKKRNGKSGNLILFVVDASGSMAANRRMEAVKGTVLSLLSDAYQQRDTVGVIAFRGITAEILLYPTQRIALAEDALKSLPTGGRTPLPHALQTVSELLQTFKHKGDYHPILILLTDGKANVALPGGNDPWSQTVVLANELRGQQIKSIVLQTDTNYYSSGKAAELAAHLGAEYRSLSVLSESQLTPILNQLTV